MLQTHEIRTPLNIIIGFSNALLAIERPEKEKEFLNAIKSSGDKILELLEKDSNEEVSSQIGNTPAQTLTRINFNEIRKLKILLVDDDRLNIKLIEHLFSEYGMKPDVAMNGKLCIDKLEQQSYDLILMDVEMPEMNGYETTVYIREKLNSHVPIIALTAHAGKGEREKCLNWGMTDYIAKPINVKHLFDVIYKTVKPLANPQTNARLAITNLSQLYNTMNGRKEAITEMLEYILQQLPVYLDDLNTAIQKTDYTAITKLAHKIKSAVGIMGAKLPEPLLADMEDECKREESIEKLVSLNAELNKICRQALEEVKEEKIRLNNGITNLYNNNHNQ